MEFTERTGPDPMDTLIEELEARTEVVVTMLRDVGTDMDGAPEKGAFAFVLGRNSDNAISVEGTVSGDNEEGVVTIWGVRDGARADVSTLEIDGQIMHTLKLV